jgi:hypothetical protein
VRFPESSTTARTRRSTPRTGRTTTSTTR